jgi:hypothetical protein
MPRRRKTFPCGHSGFGTFCRPCREREEASVRRAEERERREREFGQDPVDLRGLPDAVIRKARQVIGELADGADYRTFRGKALRGEDDGAISIPLGWSHRLLCRKTRDGIEPVRVLTHEDYNSPVRRQV